ncbi:CRP-like cAMP-binding protein [Clostridiales Family XIII bacterium PM5-7]
MNLLLSAMKKATLFQGLCEGEMAEVIQCFGIKSESYLRDEFILFQGDRAKGIGMVVTGTVLIIREDFLGNRDILTEVGSGEIFAEVYALLEDEYQSVSAVAATDAKVAFFSPEKLMTVCSHQCQFHHLIVKNMVKVMARKNLMLTRKMEHLSKKSIREKLISYLSEQSNGQGTKEVCIPFDRQQLADYLAVERSALSRELSKMRDDGLISYHKNHFILHGSVED